MNLQFTNLQFTIYHLIKKLRFHLVVKRSLISIFQFSIFNLFTYGLPLHSSLQSKSNNRKSKRSTLTFSVHFYVSAAKVHHFCETNK